MRAFRSASTGVMGILCLALLTSGVTATEPCVRHEAVTLTVNDPDIVDRFGTSVDMDGDRIIIGSPWPGGSGGDGAFIFRREGESWVQEAELQPDVPDHVNAFGINVALRGNLAVVCDTVYSAPGYAAGAIFVYRYAGSQWVFEARLQASDAATYDLFGRAIAISPDGTRIVVGAPVADNTVGEENNLEDEDGYGAAYVFHHNGSAWVEELKLVEDVRERWNRFGEGLCFTEDGLSLFVGSYNADHATPGYPLVGRGRTYVYRLSGSTWTLNATLTASDSLPRAFFGRTIDVEGDIAVIAAHCDDEMGYETGAVYVFRHNDAGTPSDPSDDTWDEQQKLTHSAPGYNGLFGMSLSISDGIILVGMRQTADPVYDLPRATAYSHTSEGWMEMLNLYPEEDEPWLYGNAAVAIESGTAVLGCSSLIDGDHAGAAYVFENIIDCNRNGLDDACDIEQGLSQDCQPNGIPDECDLDTSDPDGDGFVSSDVNENGLADECEPTPCDANELVKILAADGASQDHFGISAAMDGDVAVIGAYYDDNVGSSSGSAYVYRFSDGGTPEDPADDVWMQETKLHASDGAGGDFFGRSVAIAGNIILVGAYRNGQPGKSYAGSAYAYHYTDGLWLQQQILLPADLAGYDWFGWDVATDGDVAVISSRNDSDSGYGSGSAYVFLRDDNDTPLDLGDDTWIEMTKLVAPDGAGNDHFGESVALDGDTIVVGVSEDDDVGTNGGAAFVFQRDDGGTPEDPTDDTWPIVTKLLASDGAALDTFGMTVAVQGDTLYVGAPLHESIDHESGCVYVFERDEDSWIETARIIPFDGAGSDHFGSHVIATEDYLLVSAPTHDAMGGNAGAAYVFSRQGGYWIEHAKLLASDGTTSDELGTAIALSGNRALVTAGEDDNVALNAGAAFIYQGLDDCNENGFLDLCDVIDGTSPDTNENFIPDECEGILPDCNQNGIPDVDDIAGGTSLDCNDNGIPDDCEFPDCLGILAADMNCDDLRDGRDIQRFIDTLIQPGEYTCQADLTADGVVDDADVGPFVAAILGTAGEP